MEDNTLATGTTLEKLKRETQKLIGQHTRLQAMARINEYYTQHGTLHGCGVSLSPQTVQRMYHDMQNSGVPKPFPDNVLAETVHVIQRLEKNVAELREAYQAQSAPAQNATGEIAAMMNHLGVDVSEATAGLEQRIQEIRGCTESRVSRPANPVPDRHDPER